MDRCLRRWIASSAIALSLVTGAAVAPAYVGTAAAQDTILGIIPEPALRGANDAGCKPTEVNPRPVVLVHGFGATASENWAVFAPYLAERGLCVFAQTYGEVPEYPGRGGVKPMEDSAAELGAFVDEVLAATGAEKVDIVGHSEGGLMPRHYLKFLGGAEKVEHFVGWAAPNHGTTISGLAGLRALYPGFDGQLGAFCGACPQFLVGSEFLQRLNAGKDETVGDVEYTVLVTRYDVLVTPVQTSFLRGDNVENVVIQDVNPAAFAGHALMAADPTTFALTLDGLEYDAG